MSYESSRRQLRARADDANAGIPVWWARPPFRDYDNVPKQHVLVGYAAPDLTKVKDDGTPVHTRYDREYHALCGYSHVHLGEAAIGNPYRVRKTKPKVADRCTKCVSELKFLDSKGLTVADALRRQTPYLPPSQREWPAPATAGDHPAPNRSAGS